MSTPDSGVTIDPLFTFVLMVEMRRRDSTMHGPNAEAFQRWLFGTGYDNVLWRLPAAERRTVLRALGIEVSCGL